MGYNEDKNRCDELNLLEYWKVIKKHRWLIGGVVSITTLLAIIMSLSMPNHYKSTAVIMPIGKSGGGGMLAALASSGQLGGLSSMAGLGGVVGGQSPSQQFMALLRTRTLAEEVINRFNLIPVMFNGKVIDPNSSKGPKMEDGTKALSPAYVTFVDDKKGGTITIGAEFKDPKLAADVANGYVEGLQKFINGNLLTVAKRNRIFIEQQLEYNKRALLEAGKELNEFYQGKKVSSVEGKVDVSVKNNDIDAPQGEQIEKEDVEIQLDVLKKKKDALEEKMMVKSVPQQVYLQYLALRKNLLTQINGLLTSQYEMAKIEEAKDEPAFETIDPARVPERKSKPKRSQIVIVAFIASLLAGVFVSFFMEYFNRLKAQNEK
jgi:uncharacterized protein involved in exopolysaccharide biosynthesis